jgi:hypothetical protein
MSFVPDVDASGVDRANGGRDLDVNPTSKDMTRPNSKEVSQ